MSDSPAEPEIDEPMIERLVRAFYDRIRNDCVLGPIFSRLANVTGQKL